MDEERPAEEEGVLCAAGDLHDLPALQIRQLRGQSLVPEGARAQLPAAVAAPGVHAAARHRHCVLAPRRHGPHSLRIMPVLA
jgi:hypothetical protein